MKRRFIKMAAILCICGAVAGCGNATEKVEKSSTKTAEEKKKEGVTILSNKTGENITEISLKSQEDKDFGPNILKETLKNGSKVKLDEKDKEREKTYEVRILMGEEYLLEKFTPKDADKITIEKKGNGVSVLCEKDGKTTETELRNLTKEKAEEEKAEKEKAEKEKEEKEKKEAEEQSKKETETAEKNTTATKSVNNEAKVEQPVKKDVPVEKPADTEPQVTEPQVTEPAPEPTIPNDDGQSVDDEDFNGCLDNDLVN